MTNNFDRHALQYWKVHFDLGYYFLLVPFRFHLNRKTLQYELVTSSLQKTLRLILISLATIYFIFKIRSKFLMASHSNPSSYFELASIIFDTLALLPMYYTLGTKEKIIHEIFSYFQSPDMRFVEFTKTVTRSGQPMIRMNNFIVRPQKTRRITCMPKSKFIAIGISTTTLTIILLYFLDTLEKADWTVDGFLCHAHIEASKLFGFVDEDLIKCETRNGTTIVCDGLGIFTVYGHILNTFMNAYGDLLFASTAFFFHDLVRSFTDRLMENGESKLEKEKPALVGTSSLEAIEKVLDHYNQLKLITDKINESMSSVMFAFIFGNLPFFVTKVFDMFLVSSPVNRIIVTVICTYYFGSFYLAAKANHEAGAIRHWLTRNDNYEKIPRAKLIMLVNEISTFHPIALNPFGCFSINYTHFGSIVSIILTYAFLKFQFQGSTTKTNNS